MKTARKIVLAVQYYRKRCVKNQVSIYYDHIECFYFFILETLKLEIMKKLFLLPLVALLFATTGCTKEETVLVQSNTYVYTEYPQVNASEWTPSYNLHGDGTYTTNYLYYTYQNPYISERLLNDSFVLTYYIDDNNYDVPLPAVIKSADGLHSAIIRYDIQMGSVTFILESIDGDYTALQNFIPATMSFKVCMMMN